MYSVFSLNCTACDNVTYSNRNYFTNGNHDHTQCLPLLKSNDRVSSEAPVWVSFAFPPKSGQIAVSQQGRNSRSHVNSATQTRPGRMSVPERCVASVHLGDRPGHVAFPSSSDGSGLVMLRGAVAFSENIV